MINFLYGFLKKRKLSTLHKTASVIGIAVYYLSPSRRKVVIKNCETIGIKPDKKIVKKIYKETFKSFFEIFYVENLNEDFVKNHVICKNKDMVIEFYKKNPKVFALTGHIGSWEFVSHVSTYILKTNCIMIGRKIKNPKLDSLIKKIRSSHGNKYITHKNALKEMVRCLNENIPVGVLLDHSSQPKDAIFVEFFGIKTSFIAGAITVAVKKDVPFAPFFLIRKGQNYELITYPPIFPDKNLPVKERIYKLAQDINKIYEDIISKYPEQWFMLHKRFKRNMGEDGEITNGFYR